MSDEVKPVLTLIRLMGCLAIFVGCVAFLLLLVALKVL